MEITADTILKISRGKGDPTICSELASFITTKGALYHLDTALRIKHFLGQCAVESRLFSKLEEDLYYSAERMTQVWPSRFPSVKAAAPYAKNPRALANKTYGGRMGNKRPDDGWLYRGSALKMITGYDNFLAFTKWMQNLIPGSPDFVANPDLLRTPDWAIWPAVWYWETKKCYQFADLDDVRGLTRAINGGLIGLEDRDAMTAYAGKILNMRTDPDIQATKPKTGDPLLLEYQQKLNRIADKIGNADLNVGNPDGWNGAKTFRAVTAFQTLVNIVADGKLGPNTRLNIDVYMTKIGLER